ncbi:hypothetical protein [Thioalkalivibrio sp. ALE11]|nr:hypothetical protein [Thioalkalivibrio sp. ALE11]
MMMLIAETPRPLIRALSLEDVPALGEILGDPEVMAHSVGVVKWTL